MTRDLDEDHRSEEDEYMRLIERESCFPQMAGRGRGGDNVSRDEEKMNKKTITI